MLRIGNVYGHGFDGTALSRLETLGFAVRPEVSHYAGSQVLRFIDFERGPPLELIEVANEKEYRDFVPKGMVPYCPGISLVLSQGPKRGLADFQEGFADLRPYPLHMNYDGTADPGKTGWNYLNFAVPVVRDTFIWLTQLDDPRPPRPPPAPHPNGARGVLGLVFDLSARQLGTLSMLVGARPVHGIQRCLPPHDPCGADRVRGHAAEHEVPQVDRVRGGSDKRTPVGHLRACDRLSALGRRRLGPPDLAQPGGLGTRVAGTLGEERASPGIRLGGNLNGAIAWRGRRGGVSGAAASEPERSRDSARRRVRLHGATKGHTVLPRRLIAKIISFRRPARPLS